MNKYDFDKAKKLIREYKTDLIEASLGMHEDWFWTAEAIWKSGKYVRKLPTKTVAEKLHQEYKKERKNGMSLLDKRVDKYKSILLGGIYGSGWATPTLCLEFENGTQRMIPCYYTDDKPQQAKPDFLQDGCLSGPVQENITPLEQ